MVKIKAPKDFWAGLMFMGFGLGFLMVARSYRMGTAIRMGPGYFPSVLGGMLAVLGLVVFAGSFVTTGSKVPRLYLKPNLFVLGAVSLWAVLLKPLGLVVSIFILIFASALGGFDFRLKEVVILAIVLIVGAVGMFVYGLGLPFTLWPGQ
jgi:hypothetical protein